MDLKNILKEEEESGDVKGPDSVVKDIRVHKNQCN